MAENRTKKTSSDNLATANHREARKRLLSYAEENNLTLTGVFRNIYLEGPPQHKDKSKFITQIIAIVE